ncbi:MAG: 5'-3' exonuclease [Solirubrobacteraceae bacterium]
MPAPLLAVDAPSLLFRAWFALPDSIKDDAGRPVNALLGTANLVLFEVARHGPRAVVLCFGAEAAAYRVDAYPPYHADREDPPDGLAHQFTDARGFFAAFGWSSLHDEALEADDLLGSFAAIEAAAGGRALILTGDRDMYQCASDRTTVLYVKTGGARGAEEVGPDEVRRRYGVVPELVPDFIALRGDPSDSLPGAKGIGEKTAADLLRRHGSLEGALEHWAAEPPRVRAALREQAAELRTFKDVATLRHVDLPRPRDAPLDTGRAAAAARERGMEQLAKRIEGLAP